MNPELAWMVAIFWIGRQPIDEVSMACPVLFNDIDRWVL
jgi:hypothetical protein